jgi:hypothetical protein
MVRFLIILVPRRALISAFSMRKMKYIRHRMNDSAVDIDIAFDS